MTLYISPLQYFVALQLSLDLYFMFVLRYYATNLYYMLHTSFNC
jgi:hypothetical protein